MMISRNKTLLSFSRVCDNCRVSLCCLLLFFRCCCPPPYKLLLLLLSASSQHIPKLLA